MGSRTTKCAVAAVLATVLVAGAACSDDGDDEGLPDPDVTTTAPTGSSSSSTPSLPRSEDPRREAMAELSANADLTEEELDCVTDAGLAEMDSAQIDLLVGLGPDADPETLSPEQRAAVTEFFAVAASTCGVNLLAGSGVGAG